MEVKGKITGCPSFFAIRISCFWTRPGCQVCILTPTIFFYFNIIFTLLEYV